MQKNFFTNWGGLKFFFGTYLYVIIFKKTSGLLRMFHLPWSTAGRPCACHVEMMNDV